MRTFRSDSQCLKAGRLTATGWLKKPGEIEGRDAFAVCSEVASSHISKPFCWTTWSCSEEEMQSCRSAGRQEWFSLPIEVFGFWALIYWLETRNQQTAASIRYLISRPISRMRLEVKGALVSACSWRSAKCFLFCIRAFIEHRWQGKREKLCLTKQPWSHSDIFFGKKPSF